MLLGDVRELVPEDTGQLRLALDQTKCASGDVDDAARRRKRVDAVGIEDDELPLKVGSRAGLRQDRPDQRHVLGDRRILQDAELLADQSAHLLAELPLVLFGHVQYVVGILGVLGLPDPFGETANLRVGR